MRFKKILAGITAAALAVSSLSVALWADNTSKAVDSSEKVLYQFEPELFTEYSFTPSQDALLANATSSISVTVEGEGDEQYFYLQEKKSWKCTAGANPTVTITPDSTVTDGDTTYNIFECAKEKGLQIQFANYTSINKITLSIDGGAATTLYDIDAFKGKVFSYEYFKIEPDKLAAAGLTADNIKKCKFNLHIAEAEEGASFAGHLTKSDGSQQTEGNFSYTNVSSADTYSFSIPDETTKWNTVTQKNETVEAIEAADLIQNGFYLELKNVTISSIGVTVPSIATEYEDVTIILENKEIALNENKYATPQNWQGNYTLSIDGHQAANFGGLGINNLTLKFNIESITSDGKDFDPSNINYYFNIMPGYIYTGEGKPSAYDETTKEVTLTANIKEYLKDKDPYGAFERIELVLMANGDTATSPITFKIGKKITPVSEITLAPKTLSLVVGGEGGKIVPTVLPENATDKTVTWKSSDETIATVDSTGKVTGVKAGKATITATAGEKSAECAVTVTAKPEETQPTEPDNPTPGDTITVYELNADELKLLSDPKTTFTISYNSPNGWNDIGFGASLPDESWASASLPAKQGDGTLKVTVEDLIKSMKVKEEGDVTTLDGVTYCKVEGYNGTVFYSVKVEIPTEPDEPDKPIEGMTANLKLYTQGNDGAGWAWKDFGDDSIKTVTVSDDSEAVELKWTIAVDEKVDSADKFSAGGLQIVFDDPDCAYVGQKVNIYITEITLGGEKKDDITKEETSIVANWNNTGSEIMVNLSDISFENVGKEYSCKVKITPVSKAPDQPDQPGEDDTTTTTKAPTGFYTPDESTTTTPSDTTTAPDSGSTPVTADTTELINDDNGVKVEFAAGTVKEGAVLNVNKSGETATSATFDITLNLNGAAIQPDGTLTITINIPAGLAGAANYYVYRVEADGTYTDMLATLADGKLTFKTGHLSEYVISTVKLTDTGVVNGDDSSTASSAPVEDNGANTGNADNEPAGDNGGNGNTGSTGGNTDDKNVATGIVIAFIPAAAAAAAVVISKKRK